MKYLKTFEGLFDIFKKIEKKEIDISELRDLIESDIGDNIIFKETGPDGHKIITVESALESGKLEFTNGHYYKNRNGSPIKHIDINWFGEKIEYVSPLSSIKSTGSGITLRRKRYEFDMDMRDGFFFMYNIFRKINKDRMNEYGIGFCLGGYSHDEILFYPL